MHRNRCSVPQVEKLYVIKIGDLQLLRDGEPVTDPQFVREAGGFTFFGDAALSAEGSNAKSRYTVKVRCWVDQGVGDTPRRCSYTSICLHLRC